MQVELSEVASGLAAIFAAGGAWVTLRQVAKRGADQGRRLGKIEVELAEMRGKQIVIEELRELFRGGPYRRTAARGVPTQIDEEGDNT